MRTCSSLCATTGPVARPLHRAFWLVDAVFLTLFVAEIGARAYAFSGSGYLRHLRNPFNAIDAVLVFVSYVLLWYVVPWLWTDRVRHDYRATRQAWEVRRRGGAACGTRVWRGKGTGWGSAVPAVPTLASSARPARTCHTPRTGLAHRPCAIRPCATARGCGEQEEWEEP